MKHNYKKARKKTIQSHSYQSPATIARKKCGNGNIKHKLLTSLSFYIHSNIVKGYFLKPLVWERLTGGATINRVKSMDIQKIFQYKSTFDLIAKEIKDDDGNTIEIWYACELQQQLGYARWVKNLWKQ